MTTRFPGSPAPAESLFRPHATSLHDTFANGETILLRFPIYVDSAVTGWGWAIDEISVQSTTGVSPAEVPMAVSPAQNHPLPFNPSTTIAFSLVCDDRAELKVHDARGALVRTLDDGDVADGVYLCRLRADA